MEKFDFCGWATKNDLKCSDGRIIRKDAFKHCDGQTVPLVWNHDHSDPYRIIGHALLENRDEGVYAYCSFNDTDLGQTARTYVEHGDIKQMSIYANQLKQQGPNVLHGAIREVSLVLAGANPGAYIESVMVHGEESAEEGIIFTGEDIAISHAEGEPEETTETDEDVETEEVVEESEETEEETEETEETDEDELTHADEKEDGEEDDETVADVLKTFNDKQIALMYALIGRAIADSSGNKEKNDNSEGGTENMKHNVFDKEDQKQTNVLAHSDQQAIIKLAKQSNVGSLKAAIAAYAEENESLRHMDFVDEEGNASIETLFPDYKLLKPGAPELIERDLTWVDYVLNGIHKSPVSRIRTRNADATAASLRAKGYQKKGDEKKVAGQIKLITRTTDPQTVYRKDEMHRDDIVDITDFDVVEYMWKIMRHNMNEELALAALIGDGREEGDPDKIHETHIRSIWNDDEIYTIHKDVDIEAMKTKLQGTNTSANFGEEYIYAESIIAAALYAREKYKGSGNLDFYCTPHLLNVMLLARDLNGRRIYSSKADLAAALNVKDIHTVEQFEGKTRTDDEGGEHKLLGLFVNLGDYQFGCTKGGEINKFDDFDIDFNKYKYLMETRLSGSLTKLWSAIALEEPVTEAAG